MLAAALLLRMTQLGNPAIEVDEQFYLLVGDRLLHGQLLYLDIWDRKSPGVFAIYAAIRLLGGVGIVQYQLVATAVAAATAWVVSRIVRNIAGEWPAIVAGLSYLLWIGTVGGDGGQAPVFYNLPMAGGAALVLRALRAEDAQRFNGQAIGAMALVGLAIQIKYTAAIEGLFFGLVLTWQAHKRNPRAATVMLVLTCAFAAILPTMIAFSVFAYLGAAHEFWFANFQSIGLRDTTPGGPNRLMVDFQLSLVLGACCAASWWQLRKESDPQIRQWRLFLLGWLVAAVLGFLCVGAFFYHYLLPVYLPLSIGGAPIFRRQPIGTALATLALWSPFSASGWPNDKDRVEAQAMTTSLAALVPSQVDRGCMQMFDGPPILYHLTHACFASRWAFPTHLMSAVEAPAIGVDPTAEMRRLIAARPLVLVAPLVMESNSAAVAILRAGIARSYRLKGTVLYEDRPIAVYVSR
ncbi:hypothetical protein FHS31_000020 [Sphingomonas vulcanisoli]|uniref:Glycosyltransferase RgtA/B/C/D-like domain-containing protein n=1 Tax=Sphingomonas vulcanisoli TaxID=1658060 RepID=A0ABX0TMW7_9SPHN|nr:glycosyltransferase family 39 protein [Sphingomonas vulcanisoli]NIJ06438.1 hypothetical protein [Sphingomonas vulcanisoli]